MLLTKKVQTVASCFESHVTYILNPTAGSPNNASLGHQKARNSRPLKRLL